MVVIAVTFQLHPAAPRPGCTDTYTMMFMSYPEPGEADTATVHLQRPLGNRVVVNQDGGPYYIHPR